MKKTIWLLSVTIVVLIALSIAFAQAKGVKRKRVSAQDYGNVVINNFSEKNNVAPVVFKHWLHRTKYTCRVCHVDIGFSMKAAETGVRCDDIKKGFYCGSCHHEDKDSFPPLEKKGFSGEIKNCDRCHSYGKNVKFENEFNKITAKFPRERFGNGIDWEKAENEGIIKLKNEIQGITIKRKPLENQKDFGIESKITGIPAIIYSHKKHTVWNGCEVCHPDIFSAKKGKTQYSMEDIFDGKFCGQCHGIVAFPNDDCQRCHTEQV
ncbi:MAG: hypothetical protein HY755_10715 [Nitrospirae bacterium]|nr:hypothetical protein [Nitrospirota bacterium]